MPKQWQRHPASLAVHVPGIPPHLSSYLSSVNPTVQILRWLPLTRTWGATSPASSRTARTARHASAPSSGACAALLQNGPENPPFFLLPSFTKALNVSFRNFQKNLERHKKNPIKSPESLPEITTITLWHIYFSKQMYNNYFNKFEIMYTYICNCNTFEILKIKANIFLSWNILLQYDFSDCKALYTYEHGIVI